MVIVNRISEQEYQDLALTDTGRAWELWDGVPREKPLMSIWHDGIASYLGQLLGNQLDRRVYWVNVNGGKARLSARNYYIPDVVVIPMDYIRPFTDDRQAFNAWPGPLPLVVEVWSPSTGAYDFATKLEGYRQRGDSEIWFIHPYERTLTAWRRQADGTYAEEMHRGGVVPVFSLPGIVIDLDVLLEW